MGARTLRSPQHEHICNCPTQEAVKKKELLVCLYEVVGPAHIEEFSKEGTSSTTYQRFSQRVKQQ